jgi:hypothetical protein
MEKIKIGEGFYYNVYDIGGNRVRKELTSHQSRIKKLMSWGRVEEYGLQDVISPARDKERVEKSIGSSRRVIDAIDKKYFGDPEFINELEYEQDKAVMLLDFFKTHTEDESIAMMKKYFATLHLLWSHGFADTVYNFSINCGVSLKTGDFVYFDFNEFNEKKEKLLLDIEKKKWRTQHSLRDFPKELQSLKQKIITMFDEEITVEKVNHYWK